MLDNKFKLKKPQKQEVDLAQKQTNGKKSESLHLYFLVLIRVPPKQDPS